MKALSICQPWAHAIFHFGKNVENRSWSTPYRGPLLIHASKTKTYYEREGPADWREAGFELPAWDAMPKGGIVGVVDLVDCVRANPSLPHFVPGVGAGAGPNVWADPGSGYLWVLAKPRIFPEVIPYRGCMYMFDVADELVPAEFR